MATQAAVYTLAYDSHIFDPIVEAYKNGEQGALMDEKALQYVNKQLKNKLDRGDIVDIPTSKENWNIIPSIRWIWDGEQLLSFRQGKRDRIPQEFKVVTEFPIHYWSKTKLQGQWWDCSMVNFNCSLFATQIAESINGSVATFTHNDVKYTAVFDQSIDMIKDEPDPRQAIKDVLTGVTQHINVLWSTKPLVDEMNALVGDHTIFGSFWKIV